MTKLKSIKDAFNEAQIQSHRHEMLIEQVIELYLRQEEGRRNVFCEQFTHCLKYVLVEARPEPTVERVVKFISKCVAKLNADSNTADFFNQVVAFLLKSYDANDKAVRYRACQIIAQVIEYLGESELDDKICDKIIECMHTRLSDKMPSVRVQAIKALSRLQDPSNKQCPIIKAFQFLMGSDPNWQVRVECLRCVAPTKRTLLSIIERTRDVNEVIRRTSYHIIAEKISVKALSISQRLSLLQNGLDDRSASVRKECIEKLLQAWLVHHQANILDMLSGLDVMSSGEVCEKVVNVLLQKSSNEEILEGMDLLSEKRLIDTGRLTCESVFYYRVLLEYLSKQGDDSAEHLDKLLPDPKEFIEYIKVIAAKIAVDEGKPEDRATDEYILEQLILCIKYFDVSDPVSRKSVIALCKDLFNSDNISLSFVPELMKCLQLVIKSSAERLNEVASVLADIQMPIVVEEQPIDPDHLHQLKYKLASVNMNIHELSELLSDAVGQQNFSAAAEIKEKLSLLEVSKRALQDDMTPKPVTLPSQPKNDEVTKLKCLTIFVELLRSQDITVMTDTVRSYMDELVIPSIPDQCAAIRNQAVKALGLCSLIDQQVACRFFPVFLQICRLDIEAVRVSSLQALFDIILMHGADFMQKNEDTDSKRKSQSVRDHNDEEEDINDLSGDREADGVDDVFEDPDQESNEESPESSSSSINDLLIMMVSCLDDDSSEVRNLCAEGLAKLLLSGRVTSSKLLSRLIVLWYNPVTEEDTKLRHCLGVFFPVYAFASRANQMQTEEAFLPTLQVFFDAPKTSPLSEVDEANVAELLVQLTDHRHLPPEQAAVEAGTLTSHDSLAVKICNEILEREPSYYGVQTLTKVLTLLNISLDNEMLAKDLKHLTTLLFEVIKDKQAVRCLEKFKNKVQTLKSDSSVTVQENTELEKEDGSKENNIMDSDESDADKDIDSTVLDTTLITSKYKRNTARKPSTSRNIQGKSDQKYLDSDDSDQPINKSRRIVIPNLDEDSDE